MTFEVDIRDGRRRVPGLRLVVLWVTLQGLASAPPTEAADNLHLAPALSFTDDSSNDFPIRGDHLENAESRPGRATVMFFGASHCWNTNREAERLVALYPKYRDRVSFIIVDVANPSPLQRALVERYYRGSIPTVIVLGRDGATVYARAGETATTRGDTEFLDSLITRAAAE
jgi:hypothetical protein